METRSGQELRPDMPIPLLVELHSGREGNMKIGKEWLTVASGGHRVRDARVESPAEGGWRKRVLLREAEGGWRKKVWLRKAERRDTVQRRQEEGEALWKPCRHGAENCRHAQSSSQKETGKVP